MHVADAFGELGLWYRVAPVALVGGGFGIGGHNPWEAAHLGCAVLHGPDVRNFAGDYAGLDAGLAALPVADAVTLGAALDRADLAAIAARAAGLADAAGAALAPLAQSLTALVRR